MKQYRRVVAALMIFAFILCSSTVPGMAAGENRDNRAAETTQTEVKQSETKPAETEKSETEKRETEIQRTETENRESETRHTETESRETEKRKTEAKESETKQTESDKNEVPKQKAPARAAVMLQSPDDLVGLIKDANFRQAIFDSISAYRGGAWLAGDPDNPPASIQEILETYRGPIQASGYDEYGEVKPDSQRIKDLDGIQYLKIATADNRLYYTIDLTGNLIEDLMPIFRVCNPVSYHYGGEINTGTGTVWRNVRIDVRDNPFRCIPKEEAGRKDGLVEMVDLVSTDIHPDVDLNYYHLREDRESFEGMVRVGYLQYESRDSNDYAVITNLLLDGSKNLSRSGDFQIEQTEEGENKNKNADVRYSNLTKSGRHSIEVLLDSCLVTRGLRPNGSGYDAAIRNITSLSYGIEPRFTVFDRVRITGREDGQVNLRKTEVSTNGVTVVPGAKYKIYRIKEDQSEESVKDADGSDLILVTDSSGYTETVTVPGGRYYFKEVEAPPGYLLDPQKHEVEIGAVAFLGGGVKKLDYTSSDGTVLKAEAAKNEVFITKDMEKPMDLYLEDGNGEILQDDPGISRVSVHYRSLNGTEDVTEDYPTLSEAEAAIERHIRANDLTGAVDVKVEFAKTSAKLQTVEAEDIACVKVTVDKNWLGSKPPEETWGAVTYHLMRGDGTGDTEIEQREIPAGKTAEDYRCTFGEENGHPTLPEYGRDKDGNLVPYSYYVLETIDEEDEDYFAQFQADSNDMVKDGKEIKVKLTNYRKPYISIMKQDAENAERKLSGVKFLLERKNESGNWEKVPCIPERGDTEGKMQDTAVTDEQGRAAFYGLEAGEYRLKELKTESGYLLLKEPIAISIDPVSADYWISDYYYLIENTKKYHVPGSGGMGTGGFLCMGSMLLCAAGILQGAKKKRRT